MKSRFNYGAAFFLGINLAILIHKINRMIFFHDLLSVFPLSLKLAYTLFVFILFPFYLKKYGWANFLWFSDVTLFVSLLALWIESSMLASMMAVASLIPELAWNIEFFGRLILKFKGSGLTDYMFDKKKPRYLRALSLFHIFLPVLIVWMIFELGYDSKAIYVQTLFSWFILILSYKFSPVEENINWVFGFGKPQTRLQPLVYLALLMILLPLVIYLPTHLILKTLF